MIGSSVNPALGRIDYSPITQGAQSAAQSIQAGGQAYGQMFANLGQQIGSGIQQYQQNKQKRDFLETQVRSNIGEAIQSMNRFKADPASYNNTAPIRPEAFEGISLGELPRMPIGKLEALVNQTEKLLQKPRAIESFIQQQALTDAANQQRNAKIAGAITPPQANAPFYLSRPAQPDTQGALTKRLLEAGATPDEVATLSKALPFAQQQQLDTALHRNVIATVNAEIQSGLLKPQDFQKRYATLMANNGRNVQDRLFDAGTFVRRDNQGGAVKAVRNGNTGQIGVVGAKGFEPIDSEVYMPMTTSDANNYLDGNAFKKLGDDLVAQENSVKLINRFVEGVGNLPKGIEKAIGNASAKLKTIFDVPLTESEKAIGFSKARKNSLIGALRETIIGPGVVTEFDAERIIDALGGDIESVTTNPALLRDIVADILEGKMNQYEQNLTIYNSHATGRYGSWGVKQRNRIAPFTEYNLKSVPLGVDLDIWNAMTPDERKKFQ